MLKHLVFLVIFMLSSITFAQSPDDGILYQENFNDNSGNWWVGQGGNYNARIEGGKYIFDLVDVPEDPYIRVLTINGENNWAAAVDFTTEYELSFDFLATTSNVNAVNFYVAFDVQDNYEPYKFWILGEPNSWWNFGDSLTGVWNNDADDWVNAVNIWDGRVHRISAVITSQTYSIFADDRLIAEVPSRGIIGGSIGFGAQVGSDNTAPQPNTAYVEIDNLVVRSLQTEAVVEQPFVSNASYSDAYYEDDFSTVADWGDTANVANGVLQIPVGSQRFFSRNAAYIPRNASITDEFQIEFDFRHRLQSGSGGSGLVINFNYDIYPTSVGNVVQHVYAAFLNQGTWEWGGDGEVSLSNKQNPYRRPNPMFDGEWHRVVFNVQLLAEGMTVNLYVDDLLVASDVWDVIFLEAYRAYDVLFERVDGMVYLEGATYPLGQGQAGPNAIFEIDNFGFYPLNAAQIAAGTGLGEATQPVTTDIERLAVNTPPSWILGTKGDARDEYRSNTQVYNVSLYNSAAGVSRGGQNQLGVTIIDPVQVMEATGIVDSRDETLSDVLQRYNGGGQATAGTLPSGREFVSLNTSTGTAYALRSSDDSVVIALAEMGDTSQRSEFTATLHSILEALDYTTPSRDLDRYQGAVDLLVQSLYSGDRNLVYLAVCPGDAAGMLLFLAAFSPVTDVLLNGLFNPASPPITNVNYVLDDSGVYYETVRVTDDYAQVRLMGNVRLIFENGVVLVRPLHEGVGPALSRIGQNSYPVRLSGGTWQVCGGLIGL